MKQTNIILLSLFAILLYSASIHAQGCLGGIIFFDQNNNGIQDGAEAAAMDIEVHVVGPNGFNANLTTDANGFYEVCDLEEGNYTLTLPNLMAGYASNPNMYDFNHLPSIDNPPFNFALIDTDRCDETACLTSLLDISTGVNHNTSSLYAPGQGDAFWQLIEVPTNAGNISVPRPAFVIPSEPIIFNGQSYYNVWAETSNSGWISGQAINSWDVNGGPYVMERCFCVCEAGEYTIDMNVWVDDDADIELYTSDGTFVAFLGSATGFAYNSPGTPISSTLFLNAGDYCIRAGLINSSSTAMGLNIEGAIEGAQMLSTDCCAPSSSIVGIKYHDENCNGTQDPGEQGLANWQIQLSADNQAPITVSTDADGYYAFTDILPGVYTVSEVLQTGWTPSLPTAGTYQDVSIGSNVVNVFNFGNCEGSNCTLSHNLQVVASSSAEAELDCCWSLDYSNIGDIDVYAIRFNLLNGITFGTDFELAAGYFAPIWDNNSITITQDPFGQGPLPTNIDDILDFCMENVNSIPQYMTVEYLNEDYQTVICTETLFFDCHVSNGCLEYQLDSLVCDNEAYKFTVDFIVPSDNNFDIGFIKFNTTSALPSGAYVEPIGANANPALVGHSFSPALSAGDAVSLMYLIHTTEDLANDSLCVLITAHNNEAEQLCCFAHEACIPYPACEDPCDNVDARVTPAYQSEAARCCDGNVSDYDWMQDLLGDCSTRNCGALVSCCEYEGQRVIVIEDDARLCTDPIGTVYDCAGAVVFQYGGFGAINLDLAANLQDCELIFSCYEPEQNQCCFDLLLTDTFTTDVNLITAVQTSIITPGVNFTGQSYIDALLNGWTHNTITTNQDILWTHNTGITPNGIDDYLFTFCIDGSTSTDSVHIAVNWLNQDDIVCQDTIAVYCPDCLQIVDDQLICEPSSGSYSYQFSFMNSSAFDVNAVRIDEISPIGSISNTGVYMLGSTVPPGSTYTGSIPVQLNGSAGDSICFEIGLRQIIGDSINISCCYTTHCIYLPDCDQLNNPPCPNPEAIHDFNCLQVYDPVCGCDGVTYANICYAQNVGVEQWTLGPCDMIPPSAAISLTTNVEEQGVRLNWSLSEPDQAYDFYYLHGMWPPKSDYKSIALLETPTELSFLHFNQMQGISTYQVLGITPQGHIEASNIAEVLINELLNTVGMYSYPNPVADAIYITANRTGHATVELINPQGQIQLSQARNFTGSPVSVPTQQLANGVFIIRLRFDDGQTLEQRAVKISE